ncbi:MULTISPECIES: TolC family protein [unclassified Desulfurobacterium]|uniref:TolC family protein n=1 Tax=Desulfurobacterium sp. TC5-1 TaxID=1158318 RepID=UPI0003B4150B|nr:TolC family protein [Desulfurobacterium sp. TC5-1]
MKRTIALLLLLTANGYSMTIGELKEALKNNNLEVKQSIKSLESAQFQKRADLKKFFPVFNIQASASRFYPYTTTTGKAWENDYNAGITATANIWNFQTRTKVKIDTAQIESQKLAIDKTFEDIYLQGISYLLQLKGAEKKIALRKKELENAKKIYRVARSRYDQGLVLITDVLKARANVEKAKSTLIAAESEKEKIETALQSLLNTDRNITADVKLSDNLTVPSVKELVENAVETRKEIAIQKLKIKTAELSVQSVKDGNKPSVTVSASYFRESHDLSFENENYNFQVSLNWRIFDSFQTKYAALSAEKEKEMAEIELAKLKNQIKKEVLDSYTDFKTAKANLENARSYLRFAQKTYERTLNEYELGVSDLVSLLSAYNEYTNAEENFTDNLVNLNIAYYKLLKSAGMLGGSK